MADTGEIRAWFREDIAKVLMGVNAASRTTMTIGNVSNEFRDGFVSALLSVAMVIGIKPEKILLPDDLPIIERTLQAVPRLSP